MLNQSKKKLQIKSNWDKNISTSKYPCHLLNLGKLKGTGGGTCHTCHTCGAGCQSDASICHCK